MGKNNKIFITEAEKKTFLWAWAQRYRIIVFCLAMVVFWLSPSLPYLNLFIDKSLLIFLVISSVIVIFDLGINKVLGLVFLFLVMSSGFYFLGELETTEILGNYIYGFLLIGTVMYILKLAREIKKDIA